MKEPKNITLIKAWYSCEECKYYVQFEVDYNYEIREIALGSFREFIDFAYCKKEHKRRTKFSADFLNAPCEGAVSEDLLHSAILFPSGVQKKLGGYNSDFEKEIKSSYLNLPTLLKEDSSALLRIDDDLQLAIESSDNEVAVFYLSDLHLDYKIASDFSSTLNEWEIDAYLSSVVEMIIEDMCRFDKTVLLLAGDVSFNFNISKRFFRVLKNGFMAKKLSTRVFFVLGNHEYWSIDITDENMSIDDKILTAKNKFDKYVTVLENDLVFPYKASSLGKSSFSEKELNSMSDEEIKELFVYSGFAILGGTGFAGLNPDFNADTKIYNAFPISRKEEIERSKRFETLHERLKRIIPDGKTLVVMTHMPITDWSNKAMREGWFYISGHTHNNRVINEGGYHFLANGQVGYGGRKYKPSFFITNFVSDIFQNKEDGIYEIDLAQYGQFLQAQWIFSKINLSSKSVIMLKKSANYMFFSISEEGYLYILDGGKLKSTHGHDIDYFYQKMDVYSESISCFLKDYLSRQREISLYVRRLGGRGTIHGCIIDLDPVGTPFSYNHIYLNPIDGSVTAYYAETMTDKYVYDNLPSLLKNKLPSLFLNMKSNVINLPSVLLDEKGITSKTTFVINTDIYRISRIIRSLQYLTRLNLIRTWNYSIADRSEFENGRLLVNGLVNPNSIVAPNEKPYRVFFGKKSTESKRAISKKDADASPSESKFKKYFKNYIDDECYLRSGGKTKITGISTKHHMVECRCQLCGEIWNLDLKEKNFNCPKCSNVEGISKIKD